MTSYNIFTILNDNKKVPLSPFPSASGYTDVTGPYCFVVSTYHGDIRHALRMLCIFTFLPRKLS